MAGPQKAWMLKSIICVRLCRHTCFHLGVVVSVAWVASAGGADDSGDLPSWGLDAAVLESTIVDKIFGYQRELRTICSGSQDYFGGLDDTSEGDPFLYTTVIHAGATTLI